MNDLLGYIFVIKREDGSKIGNIIRLRMKRSIFNWMGHDLSEEYQKSGNVLDLGLGAATFNICVCSVSYQSSIHSEGNENDIVRNKTGIKFCMDYE